MSVFMTKRVEMRRYKRLLEAMEDVMDGLREDDNLYVDLKDMHDKVSWTGRHQDHDNPQD